MSWTVLLCIAGALVLVLVVFLIVWKIRARRFRPTKDKDRQQSELNQDLIKAGFAYDRHRDIFYSVIDCWQREMGYCRLYDEGASAFNMVMHCEPVTFSYANKRWLIELWKGQYGITTGGEIGIYNTDKEDVNTDGFTGPFYESALDNEMLPMSFVLRKNGKVLFKCKKVTWWLTGFKLGEYSDPDTLTMDARIKFPDRYMLQAFADGLEDIGYRRKEYSVRGRTVTIHYTAPHTRQPVTRETLPEAVVQKTNRNNCRLYNQVTHKYKDTLDKLEYLKNVAPEVYEFCMHSLYARGFYEAFSWLLDLIRKDHRPPQPCPPGPYPPGPCPPGPCPPRPCPPGPCPPGPCPPRPCPPGPCPPGPCPPRPCPPGPCPPGPCPPRPCPPGPCPPGPCPPRPCPPDPCPPDPCSSDPCYSNERYASNDCYDSGCRQQMAEQVNNRRGPDTGRNDCASDNSRRADIGRSECAPDYNNGRRANARQSGIGDNGRMTDARQNGNTADNCCETDARQMENDADFGNDSAAEAGRNESDAAFDNGREADAGRNERTPDYDNGCGSDSGYEECAPDCGNSRRGNRPFDCDCPNGCRGDQDSPYYDWR